MDNPLKAIVYNKVDDLPAQIWDELLADASVAMSRSFWRILEHARLNDFEYRYVLFVDEQGQALGLSAFYSITTDIAIFAPGPLRLLLNGVRRVFPNFLKLRMLECGTPITITSPLSYDVPMSMTKRSSRRSTMCCGRPPELRANF